MEITIRLNPDEAGHLAKYLRKRYGKSRKVSLGPLLKQAGYEAASKEMVNEMKAEEKRLIPI